MSIDTKQIIHIASEVVIMSSITAFFLNKTNKLSDQIEELSCRIQEQNNVIQQQNEIIQKHDNLILKLLNTVNVLVQGNENMCAMPPPQRQQKENTLNIPKASSKPPTQTPKLTPLPKPKPTPLPKLTPLPQNINSSKKVLIMMPNIVPVEQQPVSTSSVEEINDGDGDTNDNLSTILDEELEEELKELDEEELEKELENEENENEENQQTSVHEIIDDNE